MSAVSDRSDDELMIASSRGDTEAFGELLLRYRASVLLYLESHLGDAALAQDMAQDVFIRLWCARERYAPLGRTAQYLFTIARNTLRNHFDAMARRPQVMSLDEDSPQPVCAGTPEEVAVSDWATAEVLRAVDELPADLARAVRLHRVAGYKYREIAELVGVPVGTVKSRLHSAMSLLRERLGDALAE